MPAIEEIRRSLGGHRPRLQRVEGVQHAAVAMILRPEAVPGSRSSEVLFIERATKEGDPWSGHMALPGGRQDPTDPSLRATAERETFEEVGIDLCGAETLGRLDDLEGRRGGRPAGMVISAFVYHLPEPAALRINHEVQEAFWVPVRALGQPERQVEYPWQRDDGSFGMPAIRVGESRTHLVWGLTYRFVEHFLELLGRPIPDRWNPSLRE